MKARPHSNTENKKRLKGIGAAKASRQKHEWWGPSPEESRHIRATMGLEFLPVRDHGGSDMERFNRGTMIKSPFSGKHTYLVPAC